jgi:hypothetical protein
MPSLPASHPQYLPLLISWRACCMASGTVK